MSVLLASIVPFRVTHFPPSSRACRTKLVIGRDSPGGGTHCRRMPSEVRLTDSDVGGASAANVDTTVGGSVGGAGDDDHRRF